MLNSGFSVARAVPRALATAASAAAPARAAARSSSWRMCAPRFYATKRFTKDHEWISVSDGIGTFGITDFAQKALGDVVFVDLPEIGKSYAQKDNISAVESVKAASDIYAPVSGEVVEVNTSLTDEPSLLNTSPEADAWIAKIKLSNPSEVSALLDEAAYAEVCDE